MDAAGRKAFWDVLCSLDSYDDEALCKLKKATPWPEELCRFRAVNESALLQLQNNEQFFSSAVYYDDPFDSYFWIDFQALQDGFCALRREFDQGDREKFKGYLKAFGFGTHLEEALQIMEFTNPNMDLLELSLSDVRNLVREQIYSICFCENAMNEAVWLKYADQHKGFVQTYDFNVPSTWLCGKEDKCAKCGIHISPPWIFPVYYANEMYNGTQYAMGLLIRDKLSKFLPSIPELGEKMLLLSAVWQKERISLIKKECHCYDREWRMLLPTPYTNRPCIKLKPKSVIIGLRTPEYHRRLIISAAKIAGIQEIYQAVINEKNLLDKERIAEE